MQLPPRLGLARLPTPMQLLRRFDPGFTCPRIWVKRDDLTELGLSGNKVRKLEFCVAEALAQGCDTLITCGGAQSNLARAVALAAAQLGLGCHLVLRGEPDEAATGNLFLARLAGAQVTFVSAADYRSRIWPIMNEIAAQYATAGRKAYAMGPGASNEVGLWGYLAAVPELQADCAAHGIAPSHVVLAAGTSGTVAGLLLGTRLHGFGAGILGISVGGSGADLEVKVGRDLERWRARYAPEVDVNGLRAPILDGYSAPGYGHAPPAVLGLIGRLAREEGLLLDPVYSGKAFHGMLEEARAGRFAGAEDIVFLHTGGVFGLLAQQQNFRFG